MHKRRILLCITLAEQGGAQGFVLKLAKYLQKQGHEVKVVAGAGEWLKDECDRQNIPFIQISSMKREISPLQDLKAARELRCLLKAEKPDVIQLNSTKMGILGSLAASYQLPATSYPPPRVVYRIGGWVFLEQLPAWKKSLYKTLEKISARWKDVIICVHPGDEDVAREAGIRPRGSLMAIPNGIDIDVFDEALLTRAEARRRLQLSENDIVFGTIANFFPPKNLPAYMEACKQVAEIFPHAKFVIIGDGMERNAIEHKCAELELQNHVLLPGKIENASTLMSAFDAYALPSSKEGMSFSLLEAMAASLPIIATDVGAAKWMLSEKSGHGACGWTSPHENMTRFAEHMIEAIESLPENVKGKRARERAVRNFPLERTLRETARILTQP
jgi:glycosyltransferase involved in cell wall biosynthesis